MPPISNVWPNNRQTFDIDDSGDITPSEFLRTVFKEDVTSLTGLEFSEEINPDAIVERKKQWACCRRSRDCHRGATRVCPTPRLASHSD